ncbi:SigE family RNA polymerase sigma factor [Streptosporangium lutulentum]|uniref:RNA polymerase sigma-70 factor (Sigma-E family) n=1 Tax=Streptosporangium lutulentum TaxID=1461250 RepID=A0ABT9QPT9_9ACTN|nr:SigE family RNA polymerase sigma factor [Streptosporangium lutulentum]MDP9848761.1 RNA polymerase sigma-70 factor (sigma-E family) [Streptosporangium lutulentum]
MSSHQEFTEFVAARGTSLFRIAHLTCRSRDEAEDVLQSALEKAYRNWGRLREGSDPEPYVRRIIVNTAISRARRQAILQILSTHAPPDTPAPDTLAGVELRQILMIGLRALTPRQRAVLVLRFFEDLTEAQAAGILGCSVGTVKSQTSKALARLRALIGADLLEEALPHVEP